MYLFNIAAFVLVILLPVVFSTTTPRSDSGQALGVLLQQNAHRLLSAKQYLQLDNVNNEFRSWIRSQDAWKHISALNSPDCKDDFAEMVFVSDKVHAGNHKPILEIWLRPHSGKMPARVEVVCLERLLRNDASVEIMVRSTGETSVTQEETGMLWATSTDQTNHHKSSIQRRLLMNAIEYQQHNVSNFLLSHKTSTFLHFGHLLKTIQVGDFTLLSRMITMIPNGFVWVPESDNLLDCYILTQVLRHHDPPVEILNQLVSKSSSTPLCHHVFYDATYHNRKHALQYLIQHAVSKETTSDRTQHRAINIDHGHQPIPRELRTVLLKCLRIAMKEKHPEIFFMLGDLVGLRIASCPSDKLSYASRSYP